MTNIVSTVTKAALRPVSERAGIIGGSQVGAIAKLAGCYSSEFQVWSDFMGHPQEISDEMREAFDAGNHLEGPIADWFGDKIGQKMTELDFMYIDPDHPRLILHPDREFVELVDGKRYALECKTASSYAMRGGKWPEPELLTSDRRPSWVNKEIPIYDGRSLLPGYYAQCIWYMALAGYDGVFLARLTDNRLTIYFVEPNYEHEKYLYDKVCQWVDNVVNHGYVPSPTTVSEALQRFPRETAGAVITADDNLMRLYGQVKNYKNQMKEIEKVAAPVEAELRVAIGEAERVVAPDGAKIITYRTQTSKRLDTQSLKVERPDVYDQFVKESSSRVLKLS